MIKFYAENCLSGLGIVIHEFYPPWAWFFSKNLIISEAAIFLKS